MSKVMPKTFVLSKSVNTISFKYIFNYIDGFLITLRSFYISFWWIFIGTNNM